MKNYNFIQLNGMGLLTSCLHFEIYLRNIPLKWRSQVIQNWRDQQAEQFCKLFFHSKSSVSALLPHDEQILHWSHFHMEPTLQY